MRAANIVLFGFSVGSVLFLATAAPSSLDEYRGGYDTGEFPDGPDMYVSKRSYRPVPFPCNGYDHTPRCLHGGKGPRKTWTKSGRFCVCLCDPKWAGPECGFAMDSLPGGKRSYGPWLMAADDRQDSARK